MHVFGEETVRMERKEEGASERVAAEKALVMRDNALSSARCFTS